MLTKTLMHVHTDYSFDSNLSIDSLIEGCRRHKIGCVAVTDHDTIDGALHLARRAPFRVIVGEEVTTSEGHLIGLFLRERIAPGRSARWTAQAIRDQGGLVLLPHPFVNAFGCGLRNHSYGIVDLLDGVEINNAQNLLARPDRLAEAFAAEFGLPAFAGADTHDRSSLAPCYQWLPSFDMSAPGFKAALRHARIHRGRHPLGYFASAATRVARHQFGFSLPAGFGAQASGDSPLTGQQVVA